MNISNIFEKILPFLQKATSKEGFKIKSMVRVCVPVSMKTSVSFFDGGFKVSFPDQKPTAKVPVLPPLSILAISLNNTGGVVEIDNFPDSSFSYKEIEEIMLDLGL